MDAAPPAPPAIHSEAPAAPIAPPVVVPAAPAATDERPRDDRERALCAEASEPDWLYVAGIAVLDAGAILVELQSKNFRSSESNERDLGPRAVRYLGPLSLGLMWGFTLSGGYLALPKCSADWVRSAPPEGDVRSVWPFAAALAMLSGATAPIFLAAVEQGSQEQKVVGERSMRFVTAGVMGAVGALLPYVLPPRTWSASRELMHLRAETTPDMKGAFVSYSARF